MRKLCIGIVITGLTALSAAGQAPPQPAGPSAVEKMSALEFLIGEWEGEAWVQMGPGPREILQQREQVEWKVSGEVLLIQGRGRQNEPEGGQELLVHDALATVAWDTERQVYTMWSYAAGRGTGHRDVEVGENRFVWTMIIPGGEIRYTIELDDEGRWVETGDMSRDGGETWHPFFGMTLTRR